MKEKTLEGQVKRIILNQALSYLPDALESLHRVATSQVATESAVVSASRTIVQALQNASEGMSEDQAGEELLGLLSAAEHKSTIKTDVPEGIRSSMDE